MLEDICFWSIDNYFVFNGIRTTLLPSKYPTALPLYLHLSS